MSDTSALDALKASITAQLRPREEVARIRRVLALHLDSCLPDAPLTRPLSLIDCSAAAAPPSIPPGLPPGPQLDYLRALAANARARAELDRAALARPAAQEAPAAAAAGTVLRGRKGSTTMTMTHATQGEAALPQVLAAHAHAAALVRRRDKLAALHRHIDALATRPASDPAFVSAEGILSSAPEVPRLPADLVGPGPAGGGGGASVPGKAADVGELAGALEKAVLRAKLALARERQLLDDLAARGEGRGAGNEGKVAALEAARGELIAWIEGELGKGGGADDDDDDAEDGEDAGSGKPESARAAAGPDGLPDLNEGLASVAAGYDAYLEARKALVEVAAALRAAQSSTSSAATTLTHPPVKEEPSSSSGRTTPPPPPPPPRTHLALPAVAALLHLGRHSRSLMAQKAHSGVAIAKRVRDAGVLLDHLAAESQLLPAHPSSGGPGTAATGLGFGSIGGGGGGDSGATGTGVEDALLVRARPWLDAAEQAKLASLEAVAERLEEGQGAIEDGARILDEVDRMFAVLGVGRQEASQEGDGEEAGARKGIKPVGAPIKSGKAPGAKGSKGDAGWAGINGRI